jgi:thiamine biosynthesis lipoprotein
MAADGTIVTRAQPWLGTCVEIRAEAARLPRWQVMSAIDAAFGEIAAIHRLLSQQEHGADCVKLAQAQAGDAVSVDARTAEVLRLALNLRRESAGAFDPERSEPRACGTPLDHASPAWSVEDGPTVHVHRRAAIDLDGIAKGYAVDRAIDVLRVQGIAATVNAGGDLRTTRDCNEPLFVRCDIARGGLVSLGRLTTGAFASSQSRVQQNVDTELAGTGIDDRRSGGGHVPLMVIAVAAPTCAVADALTKVVAVDPEAALGLLESRDATAWILRELAGELRMRQLGSSSIVTVDVA